MYECMLHIIKFGDWGLGIGDWAQSPIPNPQSPANINMHYYINVLNLKILI